MPPFAPSSTRFVDISRFFGRDVCLLLADASMQLEQQQIDKITADLASIRDKHRQIGSMSSDLDGLRQKLEDLTRLEASNYGGVERRHGKYEAKIKAMEDDVKKNIQDLEVCARVHTGTGLFMCGCTCCVCELEEGASWI